MEVSSKQKKTAEEELTDSTSPLNLTPTAFVEYESGNLTISSLVLQELVKDTQAQLEGREIELPFLAKFYLQAYGEMEFNSDQKILCYLTLNAVKRKILEATQE